jgi:hypothetical protein
MKHTRFLCGIIGAVTLGFAACNQFYLPEQVRERVWALELDMNAYTIYASAGDTYSQPDPLKITVTNTGNQTLEDIGMVFNSPYKEFFSFSVDGISQLKPGEHASFTFIFPEEIASPRCFDADILVGNARAAKKLRLTFSAIGYEEIASGDFTYTEPAINFLQAGNETNNQTHLTVVPAPAPASPWFSSDPTVAAFDEDGVLRAFKGGTVVIGHVLYYMGDVPFVRGRRVTVYPAARELLPRYAAVNGVLQRPDGGTVLPLNTAEITAAKQPDTSVEFALTGGGGVVTLGDAQTGQLAFAGQSGQPSPAAVTLTLKRPVEGHAMSEAGWQYTAFQGKTEFSAAIGTTPVAVFSAARAVNQTADPRFIDIIVEFTDAVSGDISAAAGGFTFTKNGANQPFAAAVITGNVITFTLPAGAAIAEKDTLAVTYRPGTLTSDGGAVAGFTEPVRNQALSGPVLLSAEVVSTAPTVLTATFDKAPQTEDAAGFSVVVQGSPASQLPGGQIRLALSGIDGVKMTLTMNRQPVWPEISETADAKKLALAYDSMTGSVMDEKGYLAAGAIVPITLINFGEEQFKSPELKSANIDVEVSPVTLTLIYDKTLDPNSVSYSGFTLNASGLTAGGARPFIDETDSSSLILTLNRSPSLAEAANLTLSYSMVSGVIADENGNKAASVIGFPITVRKSELLGASPEVTGVAIAAAAPTTVKVTFNQSIAMTSAAGFQVAGSLTAATIIGFALTDDDKTLNLTLNQKPSYDEVSGGSFTLSYNQIAGNIIDRADSKIKVSGFERKTIIPTGFTVENDGRPVLRSVVIDAGNGDLASMLAAAKKITLTYSKPVTATMIEAFAITGSATATRITGLSVSGSQITLTLNNAASGAEADTGTVTLSYNMAYGNVRDTGTNAAASIVKKIEFRNYAGLTVQDAEKPWIVSATIEDNAKDKLRVVFSEPVTVTSSQFEVKVNYLPWKRLGATYTTTDPALDIALADRRTMTGAVAVSGGNEAVWDFTMSAPAKHGEILRLATTAEGAAQDKAASPNKLPKIPQFIARNMIKRVREVYEYEPGLYYNGVKETSVTDGTGGQMYDNFVQWLTDKWYDSSTTQTNDTAQSSDPGPNEGDVITLVLDGNQTLTKEFPFGSYQKNQKLIGNKNGATFIITTVVGTVDDVVILTKGKSPFSARHSMAWIIDEHIVFDGENVNGGFIYIADGGKVVLDGGVIRGNNNTYYQYGGLRLGGGNWGGYLIINSGKITGNRTNFSTTASQSASGGIVIDQYGIVVMNGGEISNNEASGNSAGMRAGAVVCLEGTASGYANAYHAAGSFFMTGGVIKGNKVLSTNGNIASAGGVLVSGTFQKVGGIIYGDDTGDPSLDNTTAMTGNISVSAAAVLNAPGLNAAATAKRNGTASETVSLYVDSYKPTNTSAGINSVPTWAESFWDN